MHTLTRDEARDLLSAAEDSGEAAWPSWRHCCPTLNDNFGTIGYLIIGIFVLSWVASALIYRWKGYDRLEIKAG